MNINELRIKLQELCDENTNKGDYRDGYLQAMNDAFQVVKNNAVLPHVSERVWTVDEIISVLETSADADEHASWFDKHGR